MTASKFQRKCWRQQRTEGLRQMQTSMTLSLKEACVSSDRRSLDQGRVRALHNKETDRL